MISRLMLLTVSTGFLTTCVAFYFLRHVDILTYISRHVSCVALIGLILVSRLSYPHTTTLTDSCVVRDIPLIFLPCDSRVHGWKK